jgi:hypothetical protein
LFSFGQKIPGSPIIRLGLIDQLIGQQLNGSLIHPDRTACHQPDGLHETIRGLGLQKNARPLARQNWPGAEARDTGCW